MNFVVQYQLSTQLLSVCATVLALQVVVGKLMQNSVFLRNGCRQNVFIGVAAM